jgi:hypothetical protein
MGEAFDNFFKHYSEYSIDYYYVDKSKRDFIIIYRWNSSK